MQKEFDYKDASVFELLNRCRDLEKEVERLTIELSISNEKLSKITQDYSLAEYMVVKKLGQKYLYRTNKGMSGWFWSDQQVLAHRDSKEKWVEIDSIIFDEDGNLRNCQWMDV